MELKNDFRVGISVPEAWKVLTDVERIAPLLPGAQLQEVEGDEYRGVVKVKVGPITAQYKGAATFVERDEAAGKVVLSASGRDTRGQGNASATITATMEPDGGATKVTVVTDLTVTGKVAQFGRGVLAEVSAKLLGQFVDALEADLASSGRQSPPSGSDGAASGSDGNGQPDPGPLSAAVAATGLSEAAAVGGAATSDTGPRRIDGPEAKPVDLLAVAGGSTLKRLLPVAGVAVVLFLLIARRRARKLSRLARIASSVRP
ncbi:MAG TPA: SRPBCC family protein [Acidimicrobiales bacterium]|nr:SRPBCC family protein [Acidimicrobiales bacterium]